MRKIRAALGVCLLLSAPSATAAPISRADYDAASAQASAAIDAMVAQDAATQAQLATAQSTMAIVQQQLTAAQATIAADQIAIAAKDSLIDKLRGMAPPPSVALTASPTSINLGETSTLSLAAVNTETCTPTGWDMLAPIVKPQADTIYKVDCTGWNGVVVSAQAQVSVTIPPPPPVVTSNNGFVLTNVSGAAQKGYPIQAGLPLVCGDIPHFPQAVLNSTPVATQADVKNRCPDGSAKFAVISFLADLPASGSITVKFVDQTDGNNAPMTAEQMLGTVADDVRLELTQPATLTGAMDADTTQSTWQATLLAKLKAVTSGSLAFRVDGNPVQVTGINLSAQPSLGYALAAVDAAVKAAKLPVRTFGSADGHVYAFGGKTLELATPTTGTDLGPLLFKTSASTAPQTVTSASLGQMMQAGKCTPWTQGAVAQAMLCVGDDLGFGDDGKPIQPRFYATFWPATGKVEVDVISEITNSQKLRSRFYDVRILTGKDGATEAYAQKGVAHVAGTRWVRHVWLGGAVEQRVNRKRDIGYLVDTKYLPPYDPSVIVPESVLSERYSAWQTAGVKKKIGDEGWWNTGMPAPGERPEIGWMPAWHKRYLDSGDWRARDTATVQTDLFGSFNGYYRESNPAKYMDNAKTAKGLGFPVVPYDRPTSWGDDWRAFGTAADRLVFQGAPDWSGWPELFGRNGWTKDAAHRPDPDFALYLDTGKYYYLEESQFWAAQGMFTAPPGYAYNGRGPGVRAYEYPRAQAWLTRDLANAWTITPDDSPFKAVLKDAATDFLACFEGERAVTGSTLQSHPMWKFCQGLVSQTPAFVTLQDAAATPLHWWNWWDDYPATNSAYYDISVAAGATSHWMQNYLNIVLGQVVRQGLPADGSFQWSAANLIWQATSPDYNPWLQGEYVIPNVKWLTDASGAKKAVPLQSPAETMLAWAASIRNIHDSRVIVYPGNIEDYLAIASAAGAMVAEVLNRPDVWASFRAIFDAMASGAGGQPPVVYKWGDDSRWRMVPRTTR